MLSFRSSRQLLIAAMVIGLVLRLASMEANIDFPHGDVNLDAATAKSLASGRGFWTPWEEGTAFRPDEIGLATETFGHPADQHGPLWPLLGAPLSWLTGGNAVLALQIASLLAGMALIPLVFKAIVNINERAAVWSAWTVAVLLPLVDYSANGSLYIAQTAGIFALIAFSRELEKAREALIAGAILGLLFLLNYQCIVIIPAFVGAVIFARGIRGALRPVAIAAVACLLVTIPWFIRNQIVFGSPFYNTNFEFVVHQLTSSTGLSKHAVDTSGERVLLTSTATAADLWEGVKAWAPDNALHWIVTIHLALPLLTLFALGGFARLLTIRRDGARTFAGGMIVFSFIALFIISSLWPTPKARYLVPLIALAGAAGMLELTMGARLLYSVFSLLLTIACGWGLGLGLGFIPNAPWLHITAGEQSAGVPTRELGYLLFTLIIPFLIFHAGVRRALPAIALFIIILHGAFRVTISLNKPFCARAFGIKVEGNSMFGPPTATFYEILGGPFMEGFDKEQLIDLKRAALRLRSAGATRVIAPVEISYFWDGEIVSSPNLQKRFDLDILPKTHRAFQTNGVVVPYAFLRDQAVKDALAAWVFQNHGVLVYGPDDSARHYIAFHFPNMK